MPRWLKGDRPLMMCTTDVTRPRSKSSFGLFGRRSGGSREGISGIAELSHGHDGWRPSAVQDDVGQPVDQCPLQHPGQARALLRQHAAAGLAALVTD
jgi:hypothetical protein